MIILAVVAIAVPAWLAWKYQAPGPLTWQVGLRYLLQCGILFLCGLLAMRDPLLENQAPFALGASVLFTGALVVVVAGELCQS